MNDGPDRTPDPGKGGRTTGNDGLSSDEEALPEALARLPDDRLVDADVREDLRAGREPFRRIMAARRSLPAGGVLRVRAIFEPVPLYRVMANQGLGHWTERLGPEDWRVWFFEPGRFGSASDDPGEPSGEERAVEDEAVGEGRAEDGRAGRDGQGGGSGSGRAADEIVLDVRGLEPPEPMVRTLEALEELPEGGILLQVNTRVPRFLLPRLEERGFTWEIDDRSDGQVRVRIRKAGPGEGA